MISDICHVLAVPGLEDQEYYYKLQQHLNKSKNNLIPVLVLNLTQGGFEVLEQFSKVISILNHKAHDELSIFIVFTKYESMSNDIKN